MTTTTKNAKTAALEALIEAHAIELKLPTVRRRFRQLAAEATREQQTPVAYLGALLEAEMTERAERRERRRLIDARFPAIKRLEDFRFQERLSHKAVSGKALHARGTGCQRSGAARRHARRPVHDGRQRSRRST
jgi:DNA replication protein DnaC